MPTNDHPFCGRLLEKGYRILVADLDQRNLNNLYKVLIRGMRPSGPPRAGGTLLRKIELWAPITSQVINQQRDNWFRNRRLEPGKYGGRIDAALHFNLIGAIQAEGQGVPGIVVRLQIQYEHSHRCSQRDTPGAVSRFIRGKNYAR